MAAEAALAEAAASAAAEVAEAALAAGLAVLMAVAFTGEVSIPEEDIGAAITEAADVSAV